MSETGWHLGVTDESPDVGLFVVWARDVDETLEYLAGRFILLDVTEVVWSPSHAAKSYERFFGSPPTASWLETAGAAVLSIFVADLNPLWSRGHPDPRSPRQNLRMSEAAGTLVQRFGGHADVRLSAGWQRARSDYMLLTDHDIERFEPGHNWDGTIKRIHRDLAGTNGWRDVGQMLRVLGTGSPYLVLRNFEGLADLSSLSDHGDIDLLVKDYRGALRLLGAVSRLGRVPRWGGRFDVQIESTTVICDIRFPGDGYYDARWEMELLRERVLHPDGFYVPDASNYLDSLLYHALVHKPHLSKEYRARLGEMAVACGRPDWQGCLESEVAAHGLLFEVLDERGYDVTRPNDPTVYFNHVVRGVPFPQLWRLRDALKRRIYRTWLRRFRSIGRHRSRRARGGPWSRRASS